MRLADVAITELAKIISGDSQRSPYRTGPNLVSFFNQFGATDSYGQGFPSRHQYTVEKLDSVNNSPTIRTIVEAAFDPRHFHSSDLAVENTVSHFNLFLKFDGYELFKDGLHYRIRSIDSSSGETVKNLIFAPNGPKPEIVLEDATTNNIKIVNNAEYCLVYDKGFTDDGLLWEQLVDWWCELKGLQELSREDIRRKLGLRLLESLGDNEPEKLFFTTYYRVFANKLGAQLPALVPQVYLHYDPYTAQDRQGVKRLSRERMDFLLFLPHRNYVVMEIDGKQHYSDNDRASPRLYAEMVKEDRQLRLKGYDLFRFGGYEFVNKEEAKKTVEEFFTSLFDRHSLINK